MHLVDLDNSTRLHMETEVRNDIGSKTLYLSPRLSQRGREDYPAVLLEAVKTGTPASMASSLKQLGRLNETEMVTRQGKSHTKRVPYNAAETMAEGEFNRFYIRGVCLRAIEEGTPTVRVYRAKPVSNPRPESVRLLDTCVDAAALLADLRQNVGVDTALGLPAGPNSGLSVCRQH